MSSDFAKHVASIALDQHAKFSTFQEDDPNLCNQIRKYWTETGHKFASCTDVPWSAVFVSWCVKKAGASTNDFKFAPAHSVFVHDAINNPRAYEGIDIDQEPPEVGDIVHGNRNQTTHKFSYAKKHENYPSHSAIVVEVGQDTIGHFVRTVGGNESDSVRRVRISLHSNGLIKQKPTNPYISLLKNRK